MWVVLEEVAWEGDELISVHSSREGAENLIELLHSYDLLRCFKIVYEEVLP